jgi:outer membrane receptor for ferrienterochelin and colicin
MTPLENIASSQGAGCNGDFDYTDYLYGVRAILVDETGTSKEIKVTYNQAGFHI